MPCTKCSKLLPQNVVNVVVVFVFYVSTVGGGISLPHPSPARSLRSLAKSTPVVRTYGFFKVPPHHKKPSPQCTHWKNPSYATVPMALISGSPRPRKGSSLRIYRKKMSESVTKVMQFCFSFNHRSEKKSFHSHSGHCTLLCLNMNARLHSSIQCVPIKKQTRFISEISSLPRKF